MECNFGSFWAVFFAVCTWTADCRSNVDAIMVPSDFDDSTKFIKTTETETNDEAKTKAITGQHTSSTGICAGTVLLFSQPVSE